MHRAHPLMRAMRRRPNVPWWRLRGESAQRVAAADAGVRDESLARLEAVLFLGREPIPSRKLAQLANLADATQARTLIHRLNRSYDARGTAFRVEEIAGGYQLMTRPKFGAWLRRLQEGPRETRLSGPALETLAVVAYRQPVVRAGIEAIRGVQCGEVLRQLMERDLVRIVGRSSELGRPYLYGTTKRFLELFGLRSLTDLPHAERLAAIVPPPGITTEITETNLNDSRQRESAVNTSLNFDELTLASSVTVLSALRAARASSAEIKAMDDEDDLDDEDDDELEDDEEDDDDLEDDEEEDDLEEDEWEEVDEEDDDEDEDEEDEEDEDWDEEDEDDDDWDEEEEDEEEDDDDWDDDEEEEEEEEDED